MVATRRGSRKGAGQASSQKRAGRSSDTGAARASPPQRFISFGAMGWALAAAIGAVLLRRKTPAPGICPVDPAACHFSSHLDGARSLLRMRAAALREDACNVSVSRLPEVAPGLATDAVVVDNCAGPTAVRSFISRACTASRATPAAPSRARCCSTGRGARIPATAVRRVAQRAVLIHAVNPFGMAYGRRWNEKGVDLNRNALKLSEPFEGLVDRRRDVEDAYAELSSLLNPTSWSEANILVASPLYRGTQRLRCYKARTGERPVLRT